MPSVNDILFGKKPPAPAQNTPIKPAPAPVRRVVTPTEPAPVAPVSTNTLPPVKLSLPASYTPQITVAPEPTQPAQVMAPVESIKLYLDEQIEPATTGPGVSAYVLHEHYKVIMKRKGIQPTNLRHFGMILSVLIGPATHRETGSFYPVAIRPTPIQAERQQVKAQVQNQKQDRIRRNLRSKLFR